MSTYIGKVQIGSQTASVGSTLYGVCATSASSVAKQVTLDDFDNAIHGVTVFIKFTYGNTMTSGVTLQVNTTPACNVAGNCVCDAGEILSFTLDRSNTQGQLSDESANWHWIVNGRAPQNIQIATNAPQAVGSTASLGSSTKYATEDHVHNIVVAEGSTNGQIVVAGQSVSVHGLGSAAYTDASTYAPIASPVFTGTVTLPGAPSSNLEAATKKYVDDLVSSGLGASDAMVFKGTLGSALQNPAPSITAVPNGDESTGQDYKIGWTYMIVTAGTYAGEVCEVGDLLIAVANSGTNQTQVINDHWTIAQTNINGAVTGPSSSTDEHVVVFNGTSGKAIKDSSFTIGVSVPSTAVFRDTTYSLTDGQAYTSHTLTGDTGASILASVNSGILTLAPGIKFTTANVGTSITPTVSGYNPS